MVPQLLGMLPDDRLVLFDESVEAGGVAAFFDRALRQGVGDLGAYRRRGLVCLVAVSCVVEVLERAHGGLELRCVAR